MQNLAFGNNRLTKSRPLVNKAWLVLSAIVVSWLVMVACGGGGSSSGGGDSDQPVIDISGKWSGTFSGYIRTGLTKCEGTWSGTFSQNGTSITLVISATGPICGGSGTFTGTIDRISVRLTGSGISLSFAVSSDGSSFTGGSFSYKDSDGSVLASGQWSGMRSSNGS